VVVAAPDCVRYDLIGAGLFGEVLVHNLPLVPTVGMGLGGSKFAIGRVRRHVWLVLAVPAAVCFALTAAGCHSASPKPVAGPVVTTSPSPSPSEDSKAADAQTKALAAYKGYLIAYASASQAANPDDPNLASYLADPLLSLTRHNIRILKDKGEVQIGAQTAMIVRSQADLAAFPPTVTIHACLDYSALKLVYEASRSPVPNSALKRTRVSAVVTVANYATGQWLVNDTKQGSDTC
jgi:hypothetical protein